MLLNFLWFGLILLSVLADLCSGQPFSSSQAALAGAAAGIELTLSLAGPICLWSALARAMEQTGLTAWLCRALRLKQELKAVLLCRIQKSPTASDAAAGKPRFTAKHFRAEMSFLLRQHTE